MKTNKKNIVWCLIIVFFGLNVILQIIFIYRRKEHIEIERNTKDGLKTKNMYPPLLQLSENFPKIQIIMPTMYRRTTGYEYLGKTFRSFSSSLSGLNVDFQVNAFERKSIFNNDVPLKDSNFKLTKFQQDERLRSFLKDPDQELKRVQKKYGEVNIEKIHKWNNQALDWMAMMNIWRNTNCSDSKIFLYMEDDFEICDGAMSHILSLYQWGEMHLDEWLVIRLTFGFSGLLMQCRDIPKFMEVIEKTSINQSFPIDTALALFWDPFNSRQTRAHHAYRYILFEHIGYESSVGNRRNRDYKCFGLMKSPIFHYQEQFDWNCENFMMSPCNKESVKQLVFRHIPYSDVPIDHTTREVLMRRIGHEIVGGENIFRRSCTQICEDMDMKCSPKAFQFLNNCETIKEKMNVNCRCYNMIDDEGDSLPLYDLSMNECKFLVNVTSTCDSQRWGSKRICPCMILSDEELSMSRQEPRHKGDKDDVLTKFNHIMKEFYTKVEKDSLLDEENKKESQIFKKIVENGPVKPNSKLANDMAELLVQMKKNQEKERTSKALADREDLNKF
eukprot:gene4263-7599_t